MKIIKKTDTETNYDFGDFARVRIEKEYDGWLHVNGSRPHWNRSSDRKYLENVIKAIHIHLEDIPQDTKKWWEFWKQ